MSSRMQAKIVTLFPVYCVLVAQSCPTLCNPMNYSLPGSSVHGISQARILEWVDISFSRDLPNPGIDPKSPGLQADSRPSEPPTQPINPNNSELSEHWITYVHLFLTRLWDFLLLLLSFNFLISWPHCMACRIFVPWPGIEPCKHSLLTYPRSSHVHTKTAIPTILTLLWPKSPLTSTSPNPAFFPLFSDLASQH